jgi:hypothetical protein
MRWFEKMQVDVAEWEAYVVAWTGYAGAWRGEYSELQGAEGNVNKVR